MPAGPRTSRRHVDTTGKAVASGRPDLLVLRVTLSHVGGTVVAALDALTGGVDHATAAVAEAGVENRDVRTASLSVEPEWNRHGGGQTGRYIAQQTLSMNLRDVTAAGAVIASVADAAGDAFRLDSLTWDFADPRPLLAEAREAAFRNAEAKARQYAELAGLRLGAVIRVRDADRAAPVPIRAVGAQQLSAGPAVPAGETSLAAAVAVRWRLE